MELYQALKQARIDHKLTQTKLADQLGISPQSVSKWEKGLATPSIMDIIKMADLYDMPVDNLIGHKTPAQKNASLSFEDFAKMLNTKYANNISKACEVIDEYLDNVLNFSATGDTLWDMGGKNFIVAATAYLLYEHKTINIASVTKMLELDGMSENRQQNLIQKFSTAPSVIQSYVAGYLETHSATFRGYMSVAAEQLHRLSKQKAS